MTEHEIGRAIAAGQLTSPQTLGASILVALRVSGSGFAIRAHEKVWRPASVITEPAFIERCGGLTIALGHPDALVLDGQEYADRAVGAALFGYRADRSGIANAKGEEAWAITRIFDEDVARLIQAVPCSTSPCVTFSADQNVRVGDLLIEGRPATVDHIAIVAGGVWDKGGPPTGVRIDNPPPQGGKTAMAEEAKDDPMSKLLEMVGSIATKQDSLCDRLDKLEEGAEADRKSRADADTTVGAQRDTEAAMADRRRKADAAEDEPERGGVGGPRADSEAQRWQGYAAVRADLDPVVAAFGDGLDNPFHLETPLAYRRRSLQRYIQYSARPEVRGLDLKKADANALALIQPVIIADALAHAMSPAMIPDGELREVKTRDAAGRVISTFYGKPSAWTNEFKAPKRILVRVNRNPDRT